MTSAEILQASFLDVLFENRNKMYGAYPLRKYYHTRLATALGICLSASVLLAVMLAKNQNEPGTSLNADPGDVTVSIVTIPDVPKPPVSPIAPRPPERTMPVAQRQHTQVRIVADPVETATVPTQIELTMAVISNATVTGLPAASSPPAITESGTAAKPDPAPPAETAPVNAAPAFPGGAAAWAAFLSRNLQVPEALEAAEKKTVVVKFLVSEDGRVTGFEVVQSGGAAFDAEVIRVLKKMPKWKPALQKGRAVAVPFTQPVTFMAMD